MVNTIPFFSVCSPFLVAVAGLLGESLKIRRLRETIAILASLFTLASIYMIHLAVESTPNKILLVYLHALAPLEPSSKSIGWVSSWLSPQPYLVFLRTHTSTWSTIRG